MSIMRMFIDAVTGDSPRDRYYRHFGATMFRNHIANYPYVAVSAHASHDGEYSKVNDRAITFSFPHQNMTFWMFSDLDLYRDFLDRAHAVPVNQDEIEDMMDWKFTRVVNRFAKRFGQGGTAIEPKRL